MAVGNNKVKKVAVILPVFYKGGVLKGLKNTAKMIRHASTQMGEPLEVVIAVRKGAYQRRGRGLTNN